MDALFEAEGALLNGKPDHALHIIKAAREKGHDAIEAKWADEDKVNMEPIPEYGGLMTMEEFIEDTKSGGLTDYDGSGNYSDGRMMSDRGISPSEAAHGRHDKQWSHVVWFNK